MEKARRKKKERKKEQERREKREIKEKKERKIMFVDWEKNLLLMKEYAKFNYIFSCD